MPLLIRNGPHAHVFGLMLAHARSDWAELWSKNPIFFSPYDDDDDGRGGLGFLHAQTREARTPLSVRQYFTYIFLNIQNRTPYPAMYSLDTWRHYPNQTPLSKSRRACQTSCMGKITFTCFIAKKLRTGYGNARGQWIFLKCSINQQIKYGKLVP
jgi:hypothetical protein